MGDEQRRIRELERGFRRDGLPSMIVGASAVEDIFKRAVPFFLVAFVLEVVFALDFSTVWKELLVALGALLILIGGFGLLNSVRGRRFLAIPSRMGIPELAVLVVLPALLSVVLDSRPLHGIATIVVNALLVSIAYVVIGFGLASILRWAVVRFFTHLGGSMSALAGAVPLLLFFSLVSFFTAEIWQVFTATGPATYWTAIGAFVLISMMFLAVRLPRLVRDVETESDVGEEPLRRPEQWNLAAVTLVSESLQVLFVVSAVWLFYVFLGTLLVSSGVRRVWLEHSGTVLLKTAWFGEQIQVTSEVLRVAGGVAAFAGLYYAVAILVNSAHRDQFVDRMSRELRSTLQRRSEYLELLRGREAYPVGLSSGK